MLNGDREDWGAEAYWGGMGGEVGGNKRGDKRWNRLERGREGDVWRFSLFRIIEFLFFLGFVLKMLHFVAERKIFYTFVLRTAVITYFSFPKIKKVIYERVNKNCRSTICCKS